MPVDLEQKLADLICRYSLDVCEGEVVEIRGSVIAEPLIKQLFIKLLQLGAYPVTNLSFPEQTFAFFKYANMSQLDFISDVQLTSMKTVSAVISIDAEINSRQLSEVDPLKLARRAKATSILKDIMFDREKRGDLRWNLSPCPTYGMAQDAEMSFDDYRQFVYEACNLHFDDPISRWESINIKQKNIIDHFAGKKQLHIIGEDTDLTLSIQGRNWINCNGKRNLPDGEIFTSPVENKTEGRILFDIPTTIMGVEANKVYLEFKEGRIVHSRALKGESFLNAIISTDEGASCVGEVAFGLNDFIRKATKNILFDEKIGRSIHLAIGSSYPEAGGLNKSGIHWDLIKTMREGEVYFDDVLMYKNGNFIF